MGWGGVVFNDYCGTVMTCVLLCLGTSQRSAYAWGACDENMQYSATDDAQKRLSSRLRVAVI